MTPKRFCSHGKRIYNWYIISGPLWIVGDTEKTTSLDETLSKCSSFGGSIPTPSNNKDIQQYLTLLKNFDKMFIGIKDNDNDQNSLTYLNGAFTSTFNLRNRYFSGLYH